MHDALKRPASEIASAARLAGLAILFGAVAGLGALLFREAIWLFELLFHGDVPEHDWTAFARASVPHLLLAIGIGGLTVGALIRWTLAERRPYGVPEVIEAYELKRGFLPLGAGLVAALASAIGIGCGASLGREGPAILLGATLASALNRMFRPRQEWIDILFGCGIAGAVAASFNAPLAGVFFALEVVTKRFSFTFFAPTALAGVAATVLSRLRYGDFPAFIVPPHIITSLWELPAFALLGLVAALAAVIFMQAVMLAGAGFRRLWGPSWIRPALAGILVGLIGIGFPQALGVGYEVTDAALKGTLPLGLMLALMLAKTAATAISLGGGFAGGFFSPALVVGAMTGGAFGAVAGNLLPELASESGAYALVGMAAVAAPVMGAPISTVLIVSEMTANFQIAVAALVAVCVSVTVSRTLTARSVFHLILARRGVRL